MSDPYFAYGNVGADEWDWREFGRELAKDQMKSPKVYLGMDVGKILGLIDRLDELEGENLRLQEQLKEARELEG